MPRRISRVPRYTDVTLNIPVREIQNGDRLTSFPDQLVQTVTRAGEFTIKITAQDIDERTAGMSLVIDADEQVTVLRTVQVPDGTCATCLERPVKYQGLQQCGTCYARDHRDAGKAPKTAVS